MSKDANKIEEFLEPVAVSDLGTGTEFVFYASIAISLKRIADAMGSGQMTYSSDELEKLIPF